MAFVSPDRHRHPHAGLAWVVLLHVAVLAAWWRLGWGVGLPALAAVHAVLLWGTLRHDSRMFGPVVRRLDTAQRVVWLTIDDGPSTDTREVLDLLDDHQARATFFVVGRKARQCPELLREIVRRGHEVGNHSDSHPEKWFWALGPVRMRAEIESAQATLASITGSPPRWFRAVVGMANPFVAPVLAANGLTRIGWSARGFDGVARDADEVVARIERQLAPGAIVLAHEGAAHGGNVAILAKLLARLDALGYACVLPDVVQPGQAGGPPPRS